MPVQVCSGASLRCSLGTAPSSFAASAAEVSAKHTAGVVTDVSLDNVPPFGLCTSGANPAVAAASGTSQPCVPVLTPWTPGSSHVTIDGVAALDDSSQCQCSWGGVITVDSPGQAKVSIS